MKKRHWFIAIGTLISLSILAILFARLDWQTFWQTLQNLRFQELLFATVLMWISIAIRSLRWLFIARQPVKNYVAFWQANSIGYLGNMIYPLRAGEVLKAISIKHFTGTPLGRALSTVVLDRLADVLTLGFILLFIIGWHGKSLDPRLGTGVVIIAVAILISLIILMVTVDKLHKWLASYHFVGFAKKLQEMTLHGLEAVQAFRHISSLLAAVFLSIFAFWVDYHSFWYIFQAFGWTLSFDAAVTVGVFIGLGGSLPSAPGNVGIYQIASVLALQLYQVSETQAVAYSIILQIVTFVAIGIQGALVVSYCGFNLARESEKVLEEDESLQLSNLEENNELVVSNVPPVSLENQGK